MSRSSVRRTIFPKFNGLPRRALALCASLLLILILIGGGLAQELSDTIGPVPQGVIREVSRYFADTPILDLHLSGIGFPPNGRDANWLRMPAVRKIETAYLAAQNLSQADADRLLSRLAKQTITTYEPARSVPIIAELASHDTAGPLRFGALVPVDAAAWSPPPLAQQAILEISRYADGGSLGGTANLVQFYLGVPEREAYQILRTSVDGAEAIKRAMTYVPEAERKPRMTRIINDISYSHPDVKTTPVFIAFLNDQNGNDPSRGANGRGDDPTGPSTRRPNGRGGDPSAPSAPRPDGRGGGPTGPGSNGQNGNGSTTVSSDTNRPRPETADIQALRSGIAGGWIVTRNPSGKIFVHAGSSGGYLTDLRYLIEESAGGRTWNVYLPRPANGETQYGRQVGVIERPAGVSVGSCGCR